MAVKWFNIRTKEVRVAETEPQIAAMWNSSDKGPNVQQGQDFGWRLAPEIVVKIREIREDQYTMLRIAQGAMVSVDEVDDKMILAYISSQTNVDDAPVANDDDFTDEYNAEIRRQEKARQDRMKQPESTTDDTATTTTTQKPETTTTTTTKKQ